MNSNSVLKVRDAKAVDIQKALKAAGIDVISIIEVHKEKVEEADFEVVDDDSNKK